MPEGPAEPPELVPALGETPIEDDADEAPAVVVAGQMAPHEPLIEAPVSYFVPEPEDEDETEPQPEPLPEVAAEAAEPEIVSVDSVEEDLDYIDIEPNPEPEPQRSPKAGGPSSSPGVPYKSEVEPAAE